MTQTSVEHPFIHGEFAPVSTEETRSDLSVEGALPIELRPHVLSVIWTNRNRSLPAATPLIPSRSTWERCRG